MSSRNVASWPNEQQLAAHEGFQFEMLMRTRKIEVEVVSLGLRQLTVGRARVEAGQDRILEASVGVDLGDIAR